MIRNLGFLVCVLLVFACARFHENQSPEEAIRSFVPHSWELDVLENDVPDGWTGDSSCKYIHLNNPTETYKNEFLMNQEYTAWHEFWFCPADWSGNCTSAACNGNSMVQEYPAKSLCNCTEYKIYHLSLGQNSQRNLPIKVRKVYS
jgi:hypothetical protein